jgi:hypothetical protein
LALYLVDYLTIKKCILNPLSNTKSDNFSFQAMANEENELPSCSSQSDIKVLFMS